MWLLLSVFCVTSPLIPGTPGGPWKHTRITPFCYGATLFQISEGKVALISYLVSFDADVSCLTSIPLRSDTVSRVFQARPDNLTALL